MIDGHLRGIEVTDKCMVQWFCLVPIMFYLVACCTVNHNISPKHGSALNTRNDFIRSILNV